MTFRVRLLAYSLVKIVVHDPVKTRFSELIRSFPIIVDILFQKA